ncbi:MULTISPECIES: carboxypeptidase-like regulatory domain-containing protein [unclassified Pedobacter]|uniref:carboxypeptidase-like regulatory domain-containing protein n=1 Tax=unclassified Pedobacter TaxID=2628915 RepID=UPI001E4ECD7E|nr:MULTISPECIES: carboxypeptidase-like regulatory domain-containing protein [unclassified Pedobacter]
MYKLIIFIFLALPFASFSQTVSTGTIYDYSKKSLTVPGVTIRNLNNKKVVSANAAGKFTVPAKVGDLLEFSFVGYTTDTLYLTNLLPKTIYMVVRSNNLNDVNINGVKINKEVLSKDPMAEKYTLMGTGGNLYRKKMTDKVGGLSLNLGHGKYKRQQRLEAELEQKESYNAEIDRNFTEKTIKELTKLDGEELKNFMIIYRPSTLKIQEQRPFNYPYYIAQAYQAWLKLSPKEKKLQDLPNLKKVDNQM